MSNKIVAYSIIGNIEDGVVMVQDPFDNVCVSSDISELLNFLLHSCTTRVASSALRVVWALDQNIAPIISLLPEPVKLSLASKEHRAFLNSSRLFFLPGKRFDITKCGEEASFFSLSQYFLDSQEPANVQELQIKADTLKAMLIENGIDSFTTLSSPVAIAEKSDLLKRYLVDIPTIFDAPPDIWDAYELAMQCTPREWTCNYQIGAWEQGALQSIDLASAYPGAASELINLNDCTFTRSTVMDYEAYNGILVGEFTVFPSSPHAFCSPFLADRGDGVLVNFVGARKNYTCLLDEVKTLTRYKMGTFKLDYGWFINPHKGIQPRKPFQNMMSQFYKFRSQSPTASFFWKRVMNGVVGKFLEKRQDNHGNLINYGPLFNPVFHSIVTTKTRLKVFEFLVNNNVTEEELVFVGLDEIKIARHIALPETVGLGEWRSKGSHPIIVLSPGGIITANRDFKGTSYAEIMEQICKRPAGWKFGKDRDIDLRKLGGSQIRIFRDLPKTGADLIAKKYLSSPVSF